MSKKNRGGGMGGMGGLGGLGGLEGIMRQAQEQQEKMKQRMDAQLREKIVEGTAGGGMVTVTCTGLLEVRSVKLDPSLLAPGEKDMLEDLIAAATNVALKKARALEAEAQQGELSNMMSGMGGGGMPDLSKLLGGP